MLINVLIHHPIGPAPSVAEAEHHPAPHALSSSLQTPLPLLGDGGIHSKKIPPRGNRRQGARELPAAPGAVRAGVQLQQGQLCDYGTLSPQCGAGCSGA